jgi:transcriptional regulator NrdR family protein
MKSVPEQERGLRCRKCAGGWFRVIYTRRAPKNTIMRRRECRVCKTRVTTRERIVGVA